MPTSTHRAVHSQLASQQPSSSTSKSALSATALIALAALALAWLIADASPIIRLPKLSLSSLRRPLSSTAAPAMTTTATDAAVAATSPDARPPRRASFQPRRWHERGSADHGWLKTFHTFSFASYYDPRNMDFGPLRVLNEDRVAPKEGFPRHPHNNAEIFSYILSGELTHRDSMGNLEVLKRGEVQFTSAGKGISHSEYNDHASLPVHFLQIWYTPDERNLTPKYYTLPQVPDEDKRDTLFPLIRSYKTFTDEELKLTGLLPQGRAIPAHADLTTSTSILSPGKSVLHHVGKGTDLGEGTERWIYVHVAMTNVGWKDPKDQQRALAAKLADKQSLATKTAHAKDFLGALYGWAPKTWGEAAPASISRTGRPLVTLTFAQSLDGVIAGKGGKQLQLSSDESMIMTHAMRMMHDGILVGAGTLLNDDPQLNARHLGVEIAVDNLPRPVVLDSKLRTPVTAKLIKNAEAGTGRKPLIVTLEGADADKRRALEEAGAEVVELPASAKDAKGHLVWTEVLSALDAVGIKRLMVEGGAQVIASLLRAHAETRGSDGGLIDHLIATVARKQVGSDGTSYSAPAWVAKTLLPGRGKDVNDVLSVKGGKELDQVTLTPEPFGKDLVLAWSTDAASAARISSLAISGPPSSSPKTSALIRVQGAQGGILEEGDGVYIRGSRVGETLQIDNVGQRDAEFLIFDVEPAQL